MVSIRFETNETRNEGRKAFFLCILHVCGITCIFFNKNSMIKVKTSYFWSNMQPILPSNISKVNHFNVYSKSNSIQTNNENHNFYSIFKLDKRERWSMFQYMAFKHFSKFGSHFWVKEFAKCRFVYVCSKSIHRFYPV